MKKYIIIFLLTGLSLVLPTSCLKEYLDKAPEQGLQDEQVFSKLDNFKLYFDAVYEGRKYFSNGWRDYNIKNAHPFYFNQWDQKYTWEGLTDAADMGRYMEGHTFKSGQVAAFVNKFTYDGLRRPVLESMFMDIRICNLALKNAHLLTENGVEEVEVNDLMGQAHFIRAYCHFTLFKLWGPMPYLTQIIGAEDPWDFPRLSKHETAIQIAEDFDSAAFFFNLAGRMRRDPGPGLPGHLNDPDQRRPNGVAALAFKGRALLYAASPLNNELGVTDWENAAKANWDAIQSALTNQYQILPLANWKLNYVGAYWTNEQLWAWSANAATPSAGAGTYSWNNGVFQGLISGVFGNSTSSWSGVCPTQNWVDKYETADGRALNTQADRDAAAAAGAYNEQNPYTSREPRLTLDIIYNQSAMPGWTSGKAQIFYEIKSGSAAYSELLDTKYLGRSFTGYYLRKTWGNNSQKNTVAAIYTDPLMRLTELYLNYAEAANEAYGPNTPAPGATQSALQVINSLRTRLGHVAVRAEYTGSKETFRLRIKNERNLELSFEGHYYNDIRRWMDAPEVYGSTIVGMDIEKLPAGYDVGAYPTGYRYKRQALEAIRQPSWKEPMYYLPFNTEDNFKMKKFVPNVVW
jgi:hypothetical protein